jgi:hypothetical protein
MLSAKSGSGEAKGPAAATAGPRDKDFTGCALRRSVSHGETNRRSTGLSTFLSPATCGCTSRSHIEKENKAMRMNRWKSVVSVMALAVLVSPVFAKPVVKVFTISNNQKIAGKELKSDEYTFRVDDTRVVVELRHRVVAEATGRWEPRDKKNDNDIFVSGADGQIIELRFAGEKRVFVISSM